MKRRGFLGGLIGGVLGFFGVGKAEAAAPPTTILANRDAYKRLLKAMQDLVPLPLKVLSVKTTYDVSRQSWVTATQKARVRFIELELNRPVAVSDSLWFACEHLPPVDSGYTRSTLDIELNLLHPRLRWSIVDTAETTSEEQATYGERITALRASVGRPVVAVADGKIREV